VLADNQLARWFAVVVIALNTIDQMFFIPAYPFWALTIIALDIVALWGLVTHGSGQLSWSHPAVIVSRRGLTAGQA